MNVKSFLSHIFLFEFLSDEQLERLLKFCQLINVKKSEFVFEENTPATGFFIVVSGKLKIFKLSSDGKEQILHIHLPLDVVAEAAVFDKEVYPAYCIALEDSKLVKIYKDKFLQFILDNPAVALKMLHSYSKRLREFVHMIKYLSSQDIKSRFAAFILNYTYKEGQNLCYEFQSSKKEIAKFLGTTPETLSRILSELKAQNIISEKDKKIIIHKPELLLSTKF